MLPFLVIAARVRHSRVGVHTQIITGRIAFVTPFSKGCDDKSGNPYHTGVSPARVNFGNASLSDVNQKRCLSYADLRGHVTQKSAGVKEARPVNRLWQVSFPRAWASSTVWQSLIHRTPPFTSRETKQWNLTNRPGRGKRPDPRIASHIP